MEHSITHFEIYGEEPLQIAEFYGRIFGWQVERMPGVNYWRIFPHANENGPLLGGVTHDRNECSELRSLTRYSFREVT